MHRIFSSSKFLQFLSSFLVPFNTENHKNIIKFLWVILILGASFSFKMPVATISGEVIFIKLEDIFLFFLTFFCLAQIKAWKDTYLDLPLVLFMLACIISVFFGIFSGSLASPLVGIFYLFKIAQYFLIFYLMLNTLNDSKEARFYIILTCAVAVLVALYGIIEHFFPYQYFPSDPQFYYRIYERGFFYHDAKHFSAYLMFISSIVFGLFIYSKRNFSKKIVYLAFLMLMGLSIIWTYSRSTYCALTCSLLFISGLKSKKNLIYTFLILIIVLIFFTPNSVINRVYSMKTTFLSSDPYHSSIAYRIQQINYAKETVKDYPLLGIGLGARERVFYENQFLMLISETGILGLIAFLTIIVTIFYVVSSLFSLAKDEFVRGFAAGYIAGLVGLLIESFTLVTFLISRIMVHFWIITAVLFWFYFYEKKQNEKIT